MQLHYLPLAMSFRLIKPLSHSRDVTRDLSPHAGANRIHNKSFGHFYFNIGKYLFIRMRAITNFEYGTVYSNQHLTLLQYLSSKNDHKKTTSITLVNVVEISGEKWIVVITKQFRNLCLRCYLTRVLSICTVRDATVWQELKPQAIKSLSISRKLLTSFASKQDFHALQPTTSLIKTSVSSTICKWFKCSYFTTSNECRRYCLNFFNVTYLNVFLSTLKTILQSL